MTLPVLTPTPGPMLDRLYNALPDHYRQADVDADYPLYRWLAGIAAEFGELEAMLDGINYDDTDPVDTSTLADPVVAPVAWLPWIAQLVGVPELRADLTEAEVRDAVQFASAGWRAGTKQAVADAAKTELTGTRFARVYDHSISDPGDGGQWDVMVLTRTTETPDPGRVLLAVERRNAKPAGVVLHHRAYESSWDTFVSQYATWSAIEAAGSWDALQEAGL